MSDEIHSRHIPEGMTRDCTDPWEYIQFGSDGGVSLCCVRSPVGNIATRSAADILNGAEAKALRQSLLSGEPDDICRACGLRGVASPAELQNKVREIVGKVAVPPSFDPEAYLDANPDVRNAGADAARHFRVWGRLEGRQLR